MSDTRDTNWARHAGPLTIGETATEARGRNVEGRELAGPMQGFGRMWQKVYRVALPGVDATPAGIIQTWKDHYGEFWPTGNRFHAPLAGIEPGEVGLIDADMPGRVTLSTGVMVLYADETSFTFMTPLGHPFAGWITFSADRDGGGVVWAQVDVLIRAQDPLSEIGMVLGGHRKEDRMWQATLTNLAAHVGVTADVDTTVTCVDPRRQWSRIGNVRHDAALHEAAHLAGGPARATGASWARLVASAAIASAVVQVAAMGAFGEVIAPLAVFTLLALVVAMVMRRAPRAGATIGVLLGVGQVAGGGPFLAEAMAHPESPIDFVHGALTLVASVALVVGGVAALRRRAGAPVRFAAGTAIVAALAVLVSVVATVTTGSDDPAVASSRVVAQDTSWGQDEVVVTAGSTVFVDNADLARHTFAVRGTAIDVEVPAGRGRTVDIELEPGTYELFCSVLGHESMTAVLTVTPSG